MFKNVEGESSNMTTFGEGMQTHSKNVKSTTRQMDFDEKDVDVDKFFLLMLKKITVFTNQIIKGLKIRFTSKAKVCILLCHMNSMPIVRLALLIDVKKMEHRFQMRYREGDKVFYVSTTNNKGVEKLVIPELFDSWDIQWQAKNAKFEEYLKADLDLQKLFNMMFFVWDGNHRLQALLPYIDRMYKTKENWHVSVDSIILDKKRGVVKLLVAMTNFNK